MVTNEELSMALERFSLVVSSGGEDYVQHFEQALADVVALKSHESIEPLLEFLNDDAEFDELMFSIIHGIEQFSDSVYVAHLLAAMPVLRERSPRWASVLMMRVLNSDSARAELTRQLRSSPAAVRQSARWLFEKINERHPTFLSKTTAPLSAANT